MKEALFELLKSRAYLFKPQGFRLSSGKVSPHYLDCKQVTLYSRALPLIGRLLWEEARGFEPQAVGGLTLGADPLVAAVCLAAGLERVELEGFIVRKEAKGHGTGRYLEGHVRPGMRAVILEDVVTTGASALKAAQRARDFGLSVVGVVALVDRQEGGRERLAAEGLPLRSLFTLADFLR
ncbi:orotate phosphoribosyltransferase [Thermosulfurimonas marina]|uniref:Orotate phosphoribosyltransferase n=1 Tax=Thermosulfurimonas marina TaxID=2047767 RepID=A0A6H1WUI7_9BACT|nr:orotate phosphoribosyltransferase [Thermosulfurimonas marina]QJA06850.1 orotate phosphoribosyltransferase [Thermosulfurimonas marina]